MATLLAVAVFAFCSFENCLLSDKLLIIGKTKQEEL